MADSNQSHINPNIGPPRLPNGPPGMMQGTQFPAPPMTSKGIQPATTGGLPNQTLPNMRPMMGNTQNPLPPSLSPVGGSQARPGGQPLANNCLPPNSNLINSSMNNYNINSNVNGVRTPPPTSQGFLPRGINRPPPPPGSVTGEIRKIPPTGPLCSLSQTNFSTGGQFVNGPVPNSDTSMRNFGPPPTGTPATSLPGGFNGLPNPNTYSNIASPSQPGGIPVIRPPSASTSPSSGPPKSTVNAPEFPAQTTECSGDLPVPFHGQGQYSHQVGMKLNPGRTPNNSEPPSQKSSRGPSPLGNPSYDALEGQFFENQSFTQQNTTAGTPTYVTSPPTTANPATGPHQMAGQLPSVTGPRVLGGATISGGSPVSGGPSPISGPYHMSGGHSLSVSVPTMSGGPQDNLSHGPPHISGAPTMLKGAQSTMIGGPPAMFGQRMSGIPPMSGQPMAGIPPMSGTVSGGPPSMSGTSIVSGGLQNMSGIPPMSGTSAVSGRPPPMSGIPPMSGTSTVSGGPPNMSGIPPMSGTSTVSGGPPPMSGRPQTFSSQHMSGGPPPMSGGPPPMSGQRMSGVPPPMLGTSAVSGGHPPMPGHPSMPGPPLPGAPPSAQDMNRSTGFGQQQLKPMNSQGSAPGPMLVQSNLGPPPTGPPQGGFGRPGGYQQQKPGQEYQGQGMATSDGNPMFQSNPVSMSSPMGGGMQQMTGPMGPGSLNSAFNAMGIQETSRTINLLQEKRLIPSDGVETMKPKLPHDYRKVNCSSDVFRCTLTSIPQTSSLLNKCRLPLGILIHPFKDLSQLPVIQSSVIVRCRSCRTYINPYVSFVDQRRWKCNLCYRVNELPDEFQFDPVSKTYGDPQRRPEIKSATIEFIAPTEYMLRPPPPAVYLYLLDVSFNALETGYLRIFCQTMLEELDKIPKDSRTQIGFIVYDQAIHFFNLASGLSQPQMLTVSDIEDIFLPCPDDLLVNLQESKELVIELLNQLPNMFEGNLETGSALGAALQAAHKLLSSSGGRVTVMQTVLPTIGPGALAAREDVSQRSSKNIGNLGPATDYYKKLALDCSAQQIAVDLFMLNGQYGDLASVSCISKYSGGCVQYYPSFHYVKNRGLADKYEEDLRRYLTRKIGLEAVMRIRCTKGLSIHTFHGNFFVRSTDLLSLPNINPDAGFGMQMSIEDNLTETSTACFQAALLYTSSKGERRIRVHTMCLPVTNQVNEVLAGADQRAIVCLLSKMAVDRSVTSSMSDAREAMINAAIDSLSAFGATLPSSQRMGGLPIAFNMRLLPAYILALLKFIAFRHGVNTRLDDRVFAMQQCKSLPLEYLMMLVYPNLYPVHNLDELNSVSKGDVVVCQAPLLHLSSANIDRYGVYLMDTYEAMYLYVGSAVSDQFCDDVFDVPNFMSLPEGMVDLPELDNPTSEKLRTFISNLMENRPGGPTFQVIREDSKHRTTFFQHMIEDRTESAMSYYEFLQHLQKQIKS